MKNQLIIRIGQTVRLTEDTVLGTYSLGVIDSITTEEGYAVTEMEMSEMYSTDTTVGIEATEAIDYDHFVYGDAIESIVS